MADRQIRSTTIIAVRHKGEVALGGDGQVTLGDMIIKHKSRKVRRLYKNQIITGFAGAAADALALFETLESKLDQYGGDLYRSAVEMAKDWRSDRVLRRMEATIIAVDSKDMFLISGTGDVIVPDDNIVAIGSGGGMALAAAKALVRHSDLSATEIVRTALEIVSDICIYTNNNIVIESLETEEDG